MVLILSSKLGRSGRLVVERVAYLPTLAALGLSAFSRHVPCYRSKRPNHKKTQNGATQILFPRYVLDRLSLNPWGCRLDSYCRRGPVLWRFLESILLGVKSQLRWKLESR